MPLIQVRDVPEHIYRLLADEAVRERRSLAQQAVAVLARGLQVEVDAKARRRAVIGAIRSGPTPQVGKLSDPVKMIREDRVR
jgi:hypothetical protein